MAVSRHRSAQSGSTSPKSNPTTPTTSTVDEENVCEK